MYYYPEYSHKIKEVEDQLQIIDGDFELDDRVKLLKIGGTPGARSSWWRQKARSASPAIISQLQELELTANGILVGRPGVDEGYDRIEPSPTSSSPSMTGSSSLYPSGTIGQGREGRRKPLGRNRPRGGRRAAKV
jgi:hypothetical protein